MKDQSEEAQPLGKLLQLRLTADEPPAPRPGVSPVIAVLGFIGFLVAVAALGAWIFT